MKKSYRLEKYIFLRHKTIKKLIIFVLLFSIAVSGAYCENTRGCRSGSEKEEEQSTEETDGPDRDSIEKKNIAGWLISISNYIKLFEKINGDLEKAVPNIKRYFTEDPELLSGEDKEEIKKDVEVMKADYDMIVKIDPPDGLEEVQNSFRESLKNINEVAGVYSREEDLTRPDEETIGKLNKTIEGTENTEKLLIAFSFEIAEILRGDTEEARKKDGESEYDVRVVLKESADGELTELYAIIGQRINSFYSELK